MIDYSELEKKFQDFLAKLEDYNELYRRVLNHPGSPKRDAELVRKEKELRKELEQMYGELEADIHGMAGYVEFEIVDRKRNIFLSAFDPRLDKQNYIKNLGLEYAIQCINKAIGSCRHAESVKRTDEQIIIKKGATFQGVLELRKILRKAKKTLDIQDRYLNGDIFGFIEEINQDVKIRIIIAKKYSGKAALGQIYKRYLEQAENVEIREILNREFHSRKIIIDNEVGYNLDFTFQDVGRSESFINTIKDIDSVKKEFDVLWSKSTPLLKIEDRKD